MPRRLRRAALSLDARFWQRRSLWREKPVHVRLQRQRQQIFRHVAAECGPLALARHAAQAKRLLAHCVHRAHFNFDPVGTAGPFGCPIISDAERAGAATEFWPHVAQLLL